MTRNLIQEPPRIIPLPDGRFSVSREDLEMLSGWAVTIQGEWWLSHDEKDLATAIDAAFRKDTTDETA